jgi:hypothetical protein
VLTKPHAAIVLPKICQQQTRASVSLGMSHYKATTLLEHGVRGTWIGEFRPEGRYTVMTYVMTKPCPICKQQLTKKVPTDTVQCACGKHVWQG